jgi:hypothetical protein
MRSPREPRRDEQADAAVTAPGRGNPAHDALQRRRVGPETDVDRRHLQVTVPRRDPFVTSNDSPFLTT